MRADQPEAQPEQIVRRQCPVGEIDVGGLSDVGVVDTSRKLQVVADRLGLGQRRGLGVLRNIQKSQAGRQRRVGFLELTSSTIEEVRR